LKICDLEVFIKGGNRLAIFFLHRPLVPVKSNWAFYHMKIETNQPMPGLRFFMF